MAGRTIDITALIDGRRLSAFNYQLIVLSWLITVFDGFDMMTISYTAPYLSDQFHLDKIMLLGRPHHRRPRRRLATYSLEQIRHAAYLLEGRRVHTNCALWIFTSRAVKLLADINGYTKILRDAGAYLVTDTCSAISQAVPKGTRVAALDSAKQVHYLPAMMNIEGWFGTTKNCIDAACTGRWAGQLP